MADNTVLNTGAGGDTIATDDIAGVKYQRVKLVLGADGANDGDVSSAVPMPVSGPLTDAQLRASVVPVSVSTIASSALPTGAATETTLAAVNAKLPALSTTVPDNTASGIPIRLIGEDITCASFTDVGSSLVSPHMTQLNLGTGMGVTQASGNLLVTTGTTANSDWLARSNVSWRGAWMLKVKTILSQRIVNNNFMACMADLIGTGLAVTINSTTSISVTKASHGFTAVNIGHGIFVGGVALAGCPPGRYVIASIPDANTINFTVAGWPASGSTTCTLFGWSHVKILYNGTTATASAFDCQRYGWNSGDTTLANLTTASPGHVVAINNSGRDVHIGDTLVASTTAPNITSRGNRVESVPDDNLDLYLFLWAYNGTAAPATTTTWTVGFWSVEKFANTPVYIAGARMQGTSPPVPVSGPVTVTSGTITTVSTLSAITAGANLIGDVGLGVRSATSGAATALRVISTGATTVGVLVAGTAHRLYKVTLTNNSASNAFLKLYSKASAPTVGTDTPRTTILLKAGQVTDIDYLLGNSFALGIGYGLTGLIADSDTTAVPAGDVTGEFLYL